MCKTGWLIIGAGSIGARLADGIFNDALQRAPDLNIARLVFDTDLIELSNAPNRPRSESIPIHERRSITQCLEALDPKDHLHQEVLEAVSERFHHMSLSEALGKLQVLDQMLVELKIEECLKRVFAACDKLNAETIKVAILGSLSGNFGSSFIPVLANRIRQAPKLSSQLSNVAGYIIASSYITPLLPSHMLEHAIQHEQTALNKLSQGTDPFDIFDLVSCAERDSGATELTRTMDSLARRVAQEIALG